ncbi:MAG: histidine kinase, partial [Bacteroidales bacterium]|nr:histidine kinase [Bacteroidales bacterium]
DVSSHLNDSSSMLISLRLLGLAYVLRGNYELGINSYLTGLKVAENKNNMNEILSLYNNIGSTYIKIKDYPKALKYLEIPQRKFQFDGNEYIEPRTAIYMHLGIVYKHQNSYEKSEKAYLKALELSELDNNHRLINKCYINLCKLHNAQGNKVKTMSYAQKAHQMAYKQDNPTLRAYACMTMGDACHMNNNEQLAIEYYEKALKLADSFNGYYEKLEISQIISELYALTGNYKKAYEHHKLYKASSDSIFGADKVKELTTIELQYGFDKHKAQLEQLAAERELAQQLTIEKIRYNRNLVLILSLFILLLVVFLYIVFRLKNVNRLSRLNRELVISKQHIVNQQMNPHFIFNTLSSIQYYISKHNARISMAYVSDFATLMRMMLHSSQYLGMTINKEIDSLKLYAKLEGMRLEHGLDFIVDLDSNINPDIDEVPTYVLQPILENAVEHGIEPLGKRGRIILKMTKEKDAIICKLSNNGVSLKKSIKGGEKNRQHVSMAGKLIKRRLSILSHYFGKEFSMQLYDANDKLDEVTAVLVLPNIKYSAIN